MSSYLHTCSMADFFKYYADNAGKVTFVDTEEQRAFGWDDGVTFSLHEISEILKGDENQYVALWQEKEVKVPLLVEAPLHEGKEAV